MKRTTFEFLNKKCLFLCIIVLNLITTRCEQRIHIVFMCFYFSLPRKIFNTVFNPITFIMTCFLVKRDSSPLREKFHKYLPIILHRTLLYLPFSQLKGRWRRVGCKIIGNCGNFQFLAFQLSWCTFHIASWIWCTAGHTKVSLLTWRRWFSGLLQNKADCLKGAKQKENGRQFFEEKLNITGNSPTAQRTTVGKKWKVGDLVREPFFRQNLETQPK